MDDRASLAHALKPKVKQRLAAARLQSYAASGPNWLRRPRRWLMTVCECKVPRGLGSSAAALLLLASASYGAVKGGHVPEITAQVQDLCDQAAIAAGFGISEIALVGEHEVARDDILALAGVTGRSSLLFLDAGRMRERLLANPWIAEATILKLYPGRLRIEIKERQAFALWQRGGQVALIAADGTVIESVAPPRFAHLPQVVGAGAEHAAKDFLALIARYPDIAPSVEAAVLVAERRWNLHLKGGVEVLLPEHEPERALTILADLDRAKKLLSRDIVMVDLRLSDRVTVRQSDAAAATRDEALKASAEKDKKAKGKKGERRMTVLRFGLTPKMKPVSPKRAAVVAGLDIGTSKIVCMIARLEPQAPQDALRRRSHGVRLLGFAHTAASGTKSGSVVDLVEAEEMTRQAIDIAESMAGVQLESVVVSMSGGRPDSERFVANIELSGGTVTDGDIGRVLAAASRHSVRDGRAVLHSLPIGYALDAATGIREPRGMLGHRFGVDMHMVTADVAPVRNLMLTVERSHLAVEAMVASPYVAGLAVLADDEADLGAACIDMGAGTTTLAVFSGGRFVHTDGFALGGHHVTMDLARGLNARIADAERIKAIYGSVLSGGSDERDMITVPPVGDDEREPPQFVSRAALVRIVKPRVEEILEMVRDRLNASPFAAEPRGRVVLTGGASQLAGIADLAARILRRPVRIGRPLGLAGLPDAAKGPAFAVAAGLLVYPQAAHLEHFEPRRTRQLMTGTGGYMARVGQWLRESF